MGGKEPVKKTKDKQRERRKSEWERSLDRMITEVASTMYTHV